MARQRITPRRVGDGVAEGSHGADNRGVEGSHGVGGHSAVGRSTESRSGTRSASVRRPASGNTGVSGHRRRTTTLLDEPVSRRRAPLREEGRRSFSRDTHQHKRDLRPSENPLARFLSSSLRFKIALIVGALVLVLAGGVVVDVVQNWGRIHAGVTIAGVDLGGLTRAEALARIDAELGLRVGSTPVDLFDDEQGAKLGATDATIEIGGTIEAYGATPEVTDSHSWRITAVTVGAAIDSQALVDQAYGVGRGFDFLGGRFAANMGGVHLKGSLLYGDSQLVALEGLLTTALGVPMGNADIRFDEQTVSFVLVPAVIGHAVDHDAFTVALDEAFLGDSRRAVVPMATVPVGIDNDTAKQLAQRVNEAIADPVALVYENEDSWQVISEQLGDWVHTRIEGGSVVEEPGATGTAGAGAGQLVAFVSPEKVRAGLFEVIGERDPGIVAQDAKFVVEDDKVVIVPSVDGTGIDYDKVAADFNRILFEQPSSLRKVNLAVTSLRPAITTEDAEAMGVVEKIASYSTEYPLATNQKIVNIHLAADLINNSLIEPGGIWSFNGTTGECNAERGFQEATAILDGEYVDDIGGGICQVATTIFNVVFDSGLPIEERVNHGYYLLSYPPGRDATVSWSQPDLKFSNDTGHWVLLTMSYTDTSVTATLWGTNPGYIVETGDSGFVDRIKFEHVEKDNDEMFVGETKIRQYGADGRTITVWRKVYNSSGELLREGVFRSVYAPEDEIVEIGTKPVDPA